MGAESVLKIDPATQEVTLIGDLPQCGWKWHGGVAGSDKCLYGLPNHADTVLKIVPSTGEVTTIGGPLKGGLNREGGKYEGKYKYLGGVLAGDAIYAMPGDADQVLKIECGTDKVTTIGRSFADLRCCHNKWQNGFLCRDGCIYGIPLKAESVLKIIPSTGETSTVGGPLKGFNKWEGGVLAGDGAIYCMPMISK